MYVDIYNTNKKYKIIYADPPWQYKVWSKESRRNGTASSHYNVLNKNKIQDFPIQNICDKDCVLLLWVTAPMLEDGIELIKKWGFEFKTIGFTWIKQNKKSDSLFMGMGYYTRANAELCLLATKGKPLKRISHSIHQVVISRIREHSRKPDEVRQRIVELFGDVPRIELFSRQKFDGWDCWGNQVDFFNN